MAGFRIGRGRDNRGPQQQARQQPYGQQEPYGGRTAPPYAGQQYPQQQPPQHGQGRRQAPGPSQGYGQQGGAQQWPQSGGHGEPEYFGDPHQGRAPHQDPYQRQAPDPFAANNNPGHTQAFSIDDPYRQSETYQAGSAPTGPRLHWKELLRGIVTRPGPTFLQMRDYPVWGAAIVVTLIYGLLAIFGFDGAREDVINATITTAIPYVLTTALALTLSAFILGVVTHTLARQLGGEGAWQPTVGLSMLIMTITDAPRLVFAIFMGGDAPLVQILGWITWVAAGFLFTTMVSKSHDLPWPKALGASAIQLIALLSLIKLGTF